MLKLQDSFLHRLTHQYNDANTLKNLLFDILCSPPKYVNVSNARLEKASFVIIKLKNSFESNFIFNRII